MPPADPIPFVVCKWSRRNEAQAHKAFSGERVNAILDMLSKSQSRPFRLICVTDDAEGVSSEVQIVPIPERGRAIIDEFGGQYFKLYLFSKEFRGMVGSRFIYTDLDVAIVGDMADIYDAGGDLQIMEGRFAKLRRAMTELIGEPHPTQLRADIFFKLAAKSIPLAAQYLRVGAQYWCRFNSSFMVVAPEQPDDLWTDLDPGKARQTTRGARLMGTDQAWLHMMKAGDVRTVGPAEGFWFKRDLDQFFRWRRRLPENLRMVIFSGAKSRPWGPTAQRQTWVRDLYRN